MSELKAHRFITTDELFPEANAGVLYYEKSEADMVIAENDKEIAELQKQVHDYAQGLYVIQARAEKEARHHKYKRCLANAEACMHKRWRTDEGFDYARSTRHMNKWLEIAEQFKPNNSTDQ